MTKRKEELDRALAMTKLKATEAERAAQELRKMTEATAKEPEASKKKVEEKSHEKKQEPAAQVQPKKEEIKI